MTVWTATTAVGATLLAAGALTVSQHPGHQRPDNQAPSSARAANTQLRTGSSDLDREIGRTQHRLLQLPRDAGAWATLGFDYVQQAKRTVDPSYYPKAAAALHRSLRLQPTDNFLAMAGEAALASAVHDFRGARRW